jgi:hypothetical protein
MLVTKIIAGHLSQILAVKPPSIAFAKLPDCGLHVTAK